MREGKWRRGIDGDLDREGEEREERKGERFGEERLRDRKDNLTNEECYHSSLAGEKRRRRSHGFPSWNSIEEIIHFGVNRKNCSRRTRPVWTGNSVGLARTRFFYISAVEMSADLPPASFLVSDFFSFLGFSRQYYVVCLFSLFPLVELRLEVFNGYSSVFFFFRISVYFFCLPTLTINKSRICF